MKLLQRACGALKDHKSVLSVTLSKRTSYRNPDLEAAIIKATSHDERCVDYKNAQRVFEWIRMSPVSLKPLLHALASRMVKTQSWVVALKGLILMHGVFCCRTPAVQRIGRLPFDLSNFCDGHSKPGKSWGFNCFIRTYFAFLDQRSTLLCQQVKQTEDRPLMQELVILQNWQTLLDILLQIKPMADNMRYNLIAEAMDCIVIEVVDVYSRICTGVAGVLVGMSSARKSEATAALRVVQKAKTQGDDLAIYFDFCREFGIVNAREVPRVTQIPDQELRDLERIINGLAEKTSPSPSPDNCKPKLVADDQGRRLGRLNTIITENWEIFEDLNTNQGGNEMSIVTTNSSTPSSHHQQSPNDLRLVPVYSHEIPDLISF